jgi:palmitoyltransferase ZDHHC2/15/20
MLLVFAGMHYKMVFENGGTLETLMPSFSGHVHNPYDLGYRANFEQIFGSEPLYWFLPVFTSLGDGCSFPTRDPRTQSRSPEDLIDV